MWIYRYNFPQHFLILITFAPIQGQGGQPKSEHKHGSPELKSNACRLSPTCSWLICDKWNSWNTKSHYDTASLNRSSFPIGFIFGTASASYQVIMLHLHLLKELAIDFSTLCIYTGWNLYIYLFCVWVAVWRSSQRRWSRTKYLGHFQSQISRFSFVIIYVKH